jgi:hypothetical protein
MIDALLGGRLPSDVPFRPRAQAHWVQAEPTEGMAAGNDAAAAQECVAPDSDAEDLVEDSKSFGQKQQQQQQERRLSLASISVGMPRGSGDYSRA